MEKTGGRGQATRGAKKQAAKKSTKKAASKTARASPDTTRAIVAAGGPRLALRANEFAGLSKEARIQLAVTRIRGAFGVATHSLLIIGDTVLDAAYDGDAEAALAETADENEIYTEIVRKLGTLEGGPNYKTVSVSRRIAAANRRLAGHHFWKVAPYTHKEVLVRLADGELMAEGAQQVIEMGWTVPQTAAWVDLQRKKAGKPKKKRGVRLKSTVKAAVHLAEAVTDESIDRLATEYGGLDSTQRKQVDEELGRALAALQRLRRRLRRKK